MEGTVKPLYPWGWNFQPALPEGLVPLATIAILMPIRSSGMQVECAGGFLAGLF